MTWLFTQVWLWSLAAFVLGALLSWLLFVPRLRRQNRLLRAELAEYPEYDDLPSERGGLDLLPGQQTDQWADEVTIGDWDRGPRAWDRTRMYDREVTERFAPVPEPASESPVEKQPAAWEQDDSELRLEEQRERGTPPAFVAPAEVDAPNPTAPAEGGIPETELVEHPTGTEPAGTESAESGTAEDDHGENIWFRKPELPEWSSVLDEVPNRPAKPEPAKNGHSYAGDLGIVEDIGADPAELPKRLPGVGPRPGPSMVSGVRIPGEPRTTQAGETEQPTTEQPTTESSAPEPPRTEQPTTGQPATGPTSGPTTGHLRTGQSKTGMVKGHFATRQYHTSDSPKYGEIEADVWFRTAADAEQAGFEPWDGTGRG